MGSEAVVESIEVSEESTPEMTDAQRFMASLMNSENAEHLEIATQLEERERRHAEVLQEIEAYYGDEIITYHDYTGTAVFVAESCPVGRAMAAQGFEVFRDWLEANRTEPKVESVEEAESESEEIDSGDDDLDEKRDAAQKEADTPKEATVAPERAELPNKAKNSESTTPTTRGEATDVAADKPDEVKTDLQAVSRKKEMVKPVNSSIETPSEGELNAQPITVLEPTNDTHSTETDSVVSNEAVTIENSPLPSQESVDVVSNVELVTTSAFNPEPEAASEDTHSLTDALEIEIESDAEEESREELVEIINETEPESMGNHDDVYVFYEHISEVAQQQPPLETVLIEAIRTLDETSIEKDTSELIETLEDKEEVQATVLHNDDFPETEAHELLEVLEEVEASDNSDLIEAFDQEMIQEARPELVALLLPVKKAHKAVDRLFEAKTKEECVIALQELKQELAVLLYAFGYSDPERIIQQFLSSHSVESLRDLIIELEKSLRRAAYRSVHATRVQHRQVRHVRFTKFLQFIMQTVTSKQVKSIS